MNEAFSKGLIFIILVSYAGQSQSAASVFRCVDEAGKVEFRQGRCPSGREQALRIETPKIGWIKPRTRPASDENRKSEPVGSTEKEKRRSAGESKDRLRCWEGRQKLKRIQWQRRKGYDPAAGEAMRREKRQEAAFQREFCR